MSSAGTAGMSVSGFDRVTEDGVEYLAHDVVAQKEGVYTYPDPNGGVRKEFVSAEELRQAAESVETETVVLRHPETPGGALTLTSDPRANYAEVGKWKVEPTDDGLAGRVLIRANEVGEHGGSLREYVNSVERHGYGEVSTGYDIERAEDNPGRFNGIQFQFEQKGVILDHLALLPDSQGDCSVEDGCGLGRANEIEDGLVRVNNHIPSQVTDDGTVPEDLDVRPHTTILMELGKEYADKLGLTRVLERLNGNQMDDEERINQLVEEHSFTRENLAHLEGTECLSRIHEAVVEQSGDSESDMGDENPDNPGGGDGGSSGDGGDDEPTVEELQERVQELEEQIPDAEELASQVAEQVQTVEVEEVDMDQLAEQASEQAMEQVEQARAHERNVELVAESDEHPHIDEDRAQRMNEDVLAELADEVEESEESQGGRTNRAGMALGGSFDETEYADEGGDDLDIPAPGEGAPGTQSAGGED